MRSWARRRGPEQVLIDLQVPEPPEPTVPPAGPSGASSAQRPHGGYTGTAPSSDLPPPRPIPSATMRPHPAANAWPDDAITVTYSELRRLVAFHLDQAWQGMPNREPWLWVRHRAKAMRDGETPLLLSEVMDP